MAAARWRMTGAGTIVRSVCLLLTPVAFLHFIALGQQDDTIRRMITAVRLGAGDSIRAFLPELVKTYPNEPGYVYLMALTESDGDKALRHLQAVIRSFPASEWADDALFRLYQYHYAIGAYRTADQYRSRLETEYPQSEYVSAMRSRQPDPGTAAGEVRSGGYSVQVGAYSSREEAEEILAEMKRHGYSGELRTKRIGDKNLVAVWLGVFPSLESARSFSGKLQSRHRREGIVVKR